MSKKDFSSQLKKAQQQSLEAKKLQLVNKIHYEDSRVISNFNMIKLSDILKIKESIRCLETGVASCSKQLERLN